MFFQLIDMRYEKKSTILTTNMNFNEWDGVFYDAVVANAIMDRVLHHSHVIPISGKSYRLKDHLQTNCTFLYNIFCTFGLDILY